MKKLLAVALVIFLLHTLFSCSSFGKDQVITWYDNVLKTLSKELITSDQKLIGERRFTDDQYVGAYSADCDGADGRDVIFGGASIETRRIKISAEVERSSGSVTIRLCLGTETVDYVPDENGIFEKEIVFKGAENYIMLDYEDFTGTVALSASYVE